MDSSEERPATGGTSLGHNKPPRYGERTCPGCGKVFSPKRHDQGNCSKACKVTCANREATRARQLYRMAYHWRLGGGKGRRGSLMGEMTLLVQGWMKEDRERGLPPPPLPTDLRMEAHSIATDLRTGYGATEGNKRLLRSLWGKQRVEELEGLLPE